MARLGKPAIIVAVAVGLAAAFIYMFIMASWMFASESLATRGLGVGVVLLALLGTWSTVAIVRNGLELQRISRAAAADGCELDTSDLPRRPSGRIEPEAAQELFSEVAVEYEAAPEDWRTNYRLARAYDHAGDRHRARIYMRSAVRLQRAEERSGPGAGGPAGDREVT